MKSSQNHVYLRTIFLLELNVKHRQAFGTFIPTVYLLLQLKNRIKFILIAHADHIHAHTIQKIYI